MLLKNTSATGKLRCGIEINKRIQDSFKLYWLCQECEQKLNEWETYFANNIFYPIVDGTSYRINYDKNFLKFCVSVSWRVLKYFVEKKYISHFNGNLEKYLNLALEAWQDFLLDKRNSPGEYEQHFFNFNGELYGNRDSLTPNIHRYLQRTIAIDVINNGNTALVYSKLPGLLLVGYIRLISRSKWRATRVHLSNGLIQPQELNFPIELWEYIQQKAQKTNEQLNSLSDVQKKKIDDSYTQKLDTIMQSETWKSVEKDINLFGINEAFKKRDT